MVLLPNSCSVMVVHPQRYSFSAVRCSFLDRHHYLNTTCRWQRYNLL
uniref:Uncharacterized protein n=1 Tax=Arundo donax TaxID=35708 RepID=A0A0A9GST5_ARUDO